MKEKESLVAGYNRSASAYDMAAGMYLKTLWMMLSRLSIQPFPAVLDVGCGTGLALLEVARELSPTSKLVGVDMSEGMLEVARAKAKAFGFPASFVHGDIEQIDLPAESFDLIISSGVYHWFSDRAAVTKKLARLLRPGGQIVISCVAEPGFDEWDKVVTDVYSRLPGSAKPWFPRLPTAKELLDSFRGAGLVVEHLTYDVETFIIRDPQAFVRTMSIIAPNWLSAAPEGAEAAVIKAVADAIQSKPPPGFFCTRAGACVIARKLPPLQPRPPMPPMGFGPAGAVFPSGRPPGKRG
jgi:ubiquinone/menaquinone biosynthesis C-methylase UbiE